MSNEIKYGKGLLSIINEAKLFNSNLTNKDLREAFKDFKPEASRRKPTKEEMWFGKHIWPKMNEEERLELCMLGLNGFWDGNMILMGSTAMNMYLDYRKKMIEKYDTTTS